MESSSLILALQLQQQDLDLWEQSRKGKQREGELTDVDLALEACRQELEAMTAHISDHMLALSIARAVDSDGQVIREAQLVEQQAARDREFALALSNDPNARARPITVETGEEQPMGEEEDGWIDLLRSLNLGDLPDSMSGQPESSTWASSRLHVPTSTAGHVFWAWFVRHSKMRACFLQDAVAKPSLSSKADGSLHNSSVNFKPGNWSLTRRIVHTVANHPVRRLYHLPLSMVRRLLVPDALEGLASTAKGRITQVSALAISPHSKFCNLQPRMVGRSAIPAPELWSWVLDVTI
ncbi:Ff.00g078070.m01.CDS01 [Fusarium sp. VM40]|nr:Ff.00g078070.m01.CDS01 [Fusarium sp. VM40]